MERGIESMSDTRARIRKINKSGLYVGEIIDYTNDGWIWVEVTTHCFTSIGAKLELKRWKKMNKPKEFYI